MNYLVGAIKERRRAFLLTVAGVLFIFATAAGAATWNAINYHLTLNPGETSHEICSGGTMTVNGLSNNSTGTAGNVNTLCGQPNCVTAGLSTSGFGPYYAPSIYQSYGSNTFVDYQDVGMSNLTGTMCNPNQQATNWFLTANAADNGGAVQAYPDVQQLLSGSGQGGFAALSSFNTLDAQWNTTSPRDNQGNWEEAFDIWLGGYSSDIMIWTDTSNERGSSSSYGGATIDGTATIDGVSYTLIHYGTGTDPERMLVMNTPEDFGSVSVADVLNYLISIGDIPSGVSVAQVNFGWEICHTDGLNLNYALNNYALTAS